MTIELRHPHRDTKPDPCCDDCHGEGFTRRWVTYNGKLIATPVKCECTDDAPPAPEPGEEHDDCTGWSCSIEDDPNDCPAYRTAAQAWEERLGDDE